MLIGGLGMMLTFLGVVAGTFALLPFGLLGLLLLVVGVVLITTAGRRSRPRGRAGRYSDSGYHVHTGGAGWYPDNDARRHDDSDRGSSGGYDSGPSSGGGWSGGDSGGGSSGGDSGGGGGGGGGD